MPSLIQPFSAYALFSLIHPHFIQPRHDPSQGMVALFITELDDIYFYFALFSVRTYCSLSSSFLTYSAYLVFPAILSVTRPPPALITQPHSAAISFLNLIQSYLAFLKLSLLFSLSHPFSAFLIRVQSFSALSTALLSLPQPFSAFLSLSRPYSDLLCLIQPYSTVLSLTRPCSALLSLIQPVSALLSLSQPCSA